MAYRDDSGMFEIKYKDEFGKTKTTKVYADSKSDAQREFNAEKEPGERLLSVKKIND